jgi:hypothetical protein
MYQFPPARRRPGAAVLLASFILLAAGLHLLLRQDNEWERVFVPSAARLWAGQDLYADGSAYLYPPFTAWATLPFLGMSHGLGRFFFVVLNLAGVVFVFRGAWRLAGGGPLTTAAERGAALAGGLCGVFYLHNCLVHQQTDVWIAALLVAGCLALAAGRSMLAATGFGIAAAMKCTPLLWAPYLVWRGRPAAAAWLVAVALGANLLPDLVARPPEGGTWLGEFTSRHLAPLTDRDHVPGTWGSKIIYNQSLAGAAQRWLTADPSPTTTSESAERPGISPLAIRAVLLGAEIALLALAARAFGRPFRPAGEAEREVPEYGVVLTLMLLLSPMSSMAHFGILVVPGFCLARRAFSRGDRLLTALLAAAVAAAVVSNKDLLGGWLYTAALWCGCVMWCSLLLLAGCLRELLRAPLPARVPAPEFRPAVPAPVASARPAELADAAV